jgi:putative transposase
MVQQAATVSASERQRAILEHLIRNAASTPHRLTERCRIVLMSADGVNNTEQGRRLQVDRQRIRRWRAQWAKNQERLDIAEQKGVTDRDLAMLIREVLDDAPRSGGPPKFTAEELTQIISVACEPPEDSGRPVTHWTPRELADEVTRRGLVESISPRHIGRFLKKRSCDRTRDGIG